MSDSWARLPTITEAPFSPGSTIHLLGLVACHRFRVRGFHQRIADIAQVPRHRGARFARIAGGDSLENSLMILEPDGPVILHAHMGVDFLPDAGIALSAPERIANQYEGTVARGLRKDDVETVIRRIGFAALGMLPPHQGERIGKLDDGRLRGSVRGERGGLPLHP